MIQNNKRVLIPHGKPWTLWAFEARHVTRERRVKPRRQINFLLRHSLRNERVLSFFSLH